MKMKKVKYFGLVLEVPKRAKFIATDKDGDITWFQKGKDFKEPIIVADWFWINHVINIEVERIEGVHYGTPKHSPVFNMRKKKIRKKVEAGWKKSLVELK